jgi:hypothetical protein
MDLSELLPVFVVVALLFGATVLAMSVGVIFKRPCLRGSCGGNPVIGPDGEKLSCADCPNRNRTPETGSGRI